MCFCVLSPLPLFLQVLPFPSPASSQGWAGVVWAQYGSSGLCVCVCVRRHRRSIGALVSSANIYFVVTFV